MSRLTGPLWRPEAVLAGTAQCSSRQATRSGQGSSGFGFGWLASASLRAFGLILAGFCMDFGLILIWLDLV